MMRATSMFVLVLWFLQKGAFAAYLLSTILRVLGSIKHTLASNNIQLTSKVHNESSDDSDDNNDDTLTSNVFN